LSKPGFFIYSDYGDAVFFVWWLKCEGYFVLFYVKDVVGSYLGMGLVPKTTNPVPPKGYPFAIFDSIKHGNVGREIRKRGVRVLGANPYDVKLEGDRPFGAKVMREIGIKTPEAREFRSVPLAIKFLENEKGPWFVKQIGGDTAEVSTYDAANPADLIRYLRWAQTAGLAHFQLSQRIEGTEVSCNGWFDGYKFVTPFDCTIEEKKFMPGKLGPRTGCESNVVWCLQDSKLADITVAPLADHLRAEGYVGPVDLNSLILPDGSPVGLEWTARLGFDATQAWQALIPRLGEQLAEFLSGGLDHWEHSDELSVTVRLSMPPYPSWDPKGALIERGMPLDKRWLTREGVTINDVMASSDGPVCAGTSGLVGSVGATGASLEPLVKECLDMAYDMVVPNKQFNKEPIERRKRDLPALVKLGLAGRKGF